ncbi:hypothetical protein [Sabulicella glaciei]|uniref:4-oxalocrotonate decarboxylase n=1 Tax=Sabulicella glaciei TaxID=2984948 RepID=A0ABT3P0G1_9PROT|nr:hypothetical protein [Roseococcus sp. MDT2-1-1]MCW8087907.1 hypothetical protein [Roseococcus sp. MDT2-1-1]
MSGAANWLAEAWETGNPLAPLPPEVAPKDLAEGEAQAAALVEALGLPVCGLRLTRGPGGDWLSAPLLEGRMLRAGTPVALAALRRPRLSAGVLGVLAAPLEEGGDGEAEFGALHPALDVAATRFSEGPADAAQLVADLGGLGQVLVGKRSLAPLPTSAEARLGRRGARPRPIHESLGALMARAAAEARRWGGLPAGAVLLVAGLGGEAEPQPGEKWSAAIHGVGRIGADFA